jgi:hypothetical protein
MSLPVIFAVPADVELNPDPIRSDWVLEGTPQVRSKRVAESADGTSSTMVWSCTPGRFEWHYLVDEMLYILEGEVFVTDENGAVRRLGAGDMAFFPAGAISVWQVTRDLRKVAVCSHRMPRIFGYALRAYNHLIDRLTGFSAGRGETAMAGASSGANSAIGARVASA